MHATINFIKIWYINIISLIKYDHNYIIQSKFYWLQDWTITMHLHKQIQCFLNEIKDEILSNQSMVNFFVEKDWNDAIIQANSNMCNYTIKII